MGNKEPTNSEIFALLKEIKGDINAIKQDLHSATEKFESKIKVLENENSKLKSRLLSVERKSRKNNCLIFGLKLNEENTALNEVLEVTRGKLNVVISEVDINNCYQLKHIRGAPILLELVSYLKKCEIFRNLYKLKNTGISFTDDLIYEDRQEKKQLVEYMKKAKSKDISTKLKKNKLIIAGEIFTLADLKKIDSDEINIITGSDSETETDASCVSATANAASGKVATSLANVTDIESDSSKKIKKVQYTSQKIITRNQLRNILKK